jgi:hypothetical protein
LVEIDRAERKRKRLEDRFRGYWQYVKHKKELLKKTRGITGAFVVFVAPTPQRRNHLIEIARNLPELRQHLKTSTFWFLSETDISISAPDSLLSKPIAYNLRREAGYILPQPPQRDKTN